LDRGLGILSFTNASYDQNFPEKVFSFPATSTHSIELLVLKYIYIYVQESSNAFIKVVV